MSGTDDSRLSEQHDACASADAPEQAPEDAPKHQAQGKKRRRVTTAPPEGSDPHPTGESQRHPANENDERLKGDKPPHWG